jgi:hypothetical protein
MASLDVFVSYSHKDREWKEHVVRFMNVMKAGNKFEFQVWHDSQIKLGEKWEDKINMAINNAKVAVLLISSDFLQSDFILNHEVPKIIERSNKGELKIVPVIIRPCPWEIFDWISPYQGYLEDENILSGSNDFKLEMTLTELVREIERLVSNEAVAEEIEEPAPPTIEIAKSPEPMESIGSGTIKDIDGFLNEKGIGDIIENSMKNPSKSKVLNQIIIFKTRKQHTWFAVTSDSIFCVLDDEKTLKAGRQVQWRLPLIDADPVNVRERKQKPTGLVDIGPRRNWLYSQRIHPGAKKFQQEIETIIQNAQKS